MSAVQPAAGFDDGPLGANVAIDLRAVAARIRDRITTSVIETGRDLLAVKNRLGHGEFIRWVEDECHLTPRTAQRMMAAADWAKGKSDSVSHLPPTILYALSSQTTPEAVRAEITHRIEAGETIEPIEVVNKIREAREEERFINKQRRLSRVKKATVAQTESHRRHYDAEDHEDQERQQACVDLADLLVREVRDQKGLVALLKVANPELHRLVQQRLCPGSADSGPHSLGDDEISLPSVPQYRCTVPPIETAARSLGGCCSTLLAAFREIPTASRVKVRDWVLRGYKLEEPAPYDVVARPFVALWLAAETEARKKLLSDLLAEEHAP